MGVRETLSVAVYGLAFCLCMQPIQSVFAAQPDWSEGASIPEEGRANPYELPEAEYVKAIHQGQIHTQWYPVAVTGILPPYAPAKKVLDNNTGNPIKKIMNEVLQNVSGYESFDDMLKWVGLNPYPKATDAGVYGVAYPEGHRPDYPMGLGWIERNGARGFTFSCAACHSSQLFGKTVLGMTNRFPRANDFFINAKKVAPYLSSSMVRLYAKATEAEGELVDEIKTHIKRVGLKKPLVLGLDTSLAQVSLSLNHREADPWATPNERFERRPRPDMLDKNPADSKPAVWWNLKYKNRWLSDGSVIAGQPIYTNILWNEIGRGADLKALAQWISQNPQAIEDLTTAVFSSEAPRITDFFLAEKIDLESAKKGQRIFSKTCSRCHGSYEKAWDNPQMTAERSQVTTADLMKTTRVIYHEKTPVVNVGTDPWRARGMKSLEKLNHLEISKQLGIVIQAQSGYVPPPLVGIWARWPYMHNNSIPNLCALLTPTSKRPKTYWAGEAKNPDQDFDFACNGYPLEEKTPQAWKTSEYFYDSSRQGLSNAGHDEGIFIKNGQEILSAQDKKDLISFLQTL